MQSLFAVGPSVLPISTSVRNPHKNCLLAQEIQEAKSAGAQVVELRLDYLEDLPLEDPQPALERLLGCCKTQRTPAIVTFRPEWEG